MLSLVHLFLVDEVTSLLDFSIDGMKSEVLFATRFTSWVRVEVVHLRLLYLA